VHNVQNISLIAYLKNTYSFSEKKKKTKKHTVNWSYQIQIWKEVDVVQELGVVHPPQACTWQPFLIKPQILPSLMHNLFFNFGNQLDALKGGPLYSL
jgi:hypothetical protein